MKDIIETAAKAILHFWWILAAIGSVVVILYALNWPDTQQEVVQTIKDGTYPAPPRP